MTRTLLLGGLLLAIVVMTLVAAVIVGRGERMP
jgi:hypothetical protein